MVHQGENAPELSRLWRQMFDAIPDLVTILDRDHRILWLNRAAADRLGTSREAAIGRRCFELMHGTSQPPTGCPHCQLLKDGASHTWEGTIENVDGFFLISASPLQDPSGRMMGSVHIARDITRERQVEDNLRRERDFTAAILEIMDALIVVLDREGRIIHFNRACELLTGYRAAEVKGRRLWELFLLPEEQEAVMGVFASLKQGAFPTRHENHWLTKDGERRLISWSNTALLGADGSVRYVISTGTDITERQQAEERMSRLAHYDLLTDLPNRKLFADRLQQALARGRRYHQLVAVLFLDLDNFKPVNDRYGHETGDLLLKEVAARLKGSIRETDTVGRLGGDEFVAAIEGLKNKEDVAPVARKIIAALSAPFALEGCRCTIGVSVGAAFYPVDGAEMDSLIKKADQAMYEVKKEGGNAYRWYEQREEQPVDF